MCCSQIDDPMHNAEQKKTIFKAMFILERRGVLYRSPRNSLGGEKVQWSLQRTRQHMSPFVVPPLMAPRWQGVQGKVQLVVGQHPSRCLRPTLDR